MNDAIDACLRGVVSAEIAIARMILAGMTGDAIREAVMACRDDGPRWRVLCATFFRHEDRLSGLAALADGISHEGGDVRLMFDSIAAAAPDCGAAFYALGDAEVLARATQDIVEWLNDRKLVTPASRVLDFGCGPGRMAAALAAQCGTVMGVDVSGGMIAEARRRLPALRFEQIAPGKLAPGGAGPFDLILAVDVFPYLVMAGADVAACVMRAASGQLRDGGTLVLFNLSYRGDWDQDLRDAKGWARAYGFTLEAERAPFRLWDGSAFTFRRERGLLPL